MYGILDALDEAIVFTDRDGVIRQINRRAEQLFDVDPKQFSGGPRVALARRIAVQTEDPDGFMEMLQQLRTDPTGELRFEIEQVLPARRHLRVYSGPARTSSGVDIGRIDVFTDISETVQHALELQQVYERARAAAESYRLSLLPEGTPSLPHFNLVAHYVPADNWAVCADFYDFLPGADGKFGLVIGDVCGVGPGAANDSALARHSVRSFLAEESDPGRLLTLVNQHIFNQIGSERFVRLAFGLLDPERAVLEYSSAGHVPPILYRAKTEEVEWLEERGVALAISPGARYRTSRLQLDPGDMLIFYTDGVTEAARHGRPFGQRKLADLVKEYGVGTPGEFVQAIRRAVGAWVAGGEHRDDVALLVSQMAPDRAAHETMRELVLPNEAARIRDIRRFVGGFLAEIRAPVETLYEILLAVGEAAANACRYGRKPDTWSELRIQCRLERPDVIVSLSDEGPGFDPGEFEVSKLPDTLASGGRGLFLMDQLMDKVEIDSSREGTTVTLRRRVFDNGSSEEESVDAGSADR